MASKGGMRSGLEASIASQLVTQGVDFGYESEKVDYLIPAKYIPDFVLPGGIIIEAKGMLTQRDRKKMLLVKSQHPELDIRFVLSSPNKKILPKSKTTYSKWCEKNRFPWAEKRVPPDWLAEAREWNKRKPPRVAAW